MKICQRLDGSLVASGRMDVLALMSSERMDTASVVVPRNRELLLVGMAIASESLNKRTSESSGRVEVLRAFFTASRLAAGLWLQPVWLQPRLVVRCCC